MDKGLEFYNLQSHISLCHSVQDEGGNKSSPSPEHTGDCSFYAAKRIGYLIIYVHVESGDVCVESCLQFSCMAC